MTAIDIVPFDIAGVDCNIADVTKLPFADRSFQVVLCAEVLEHIPEVEQAASEIERVAEKAVVIGVPFNQDLRAGKTTCNHCGSVCPAWGHVNSFTARRLTELFPAMRAEIEFVGAPEGRTTTIASTLMTAAGNPWGCYNEPCPACGKIMRAPGRTGIKKLLSSIAARMDKVQEKLQRPGANWIHL